MKEISFLGISLHNNYLAEMEQERKSFLKAFNLETGIDFFPVSPMICPISPLKNEDINSKNTLSKFARLFEHIDFSVEQLDYDEKNSSYCRKLSLKDNIGLEKFEFNFFSHKLSSYMFNYGFSEKKVDLSLFERNNVIYPNVFLVTFYTLYYNRINDGSFETRLIQHQSKWVKKKV